MPDEKNISLPLQIERLAGDEEALTLPVSFASESVIHDPVYGPIKLSLEAGAVDLSDAEERGLPVRTMHMRDLPKARVHEVRVEDGKMRGDMRFSRTTEGRELYQDAADGIITDTSVGASIYDGYMTDDYLLATKWKPIEVSLVDDGADKSVGINRAAPKEALPEKPAQELPRAAERAVPAEQPAEAAQPSESEPAAPAAQPLEVTRMATEPNLDAPAGAATPAAQTDTDKQAGNIKAIGQLAEYAHKRAPELGIDRIADDYVAFGKPFDEFKTKVWGMMAERQDKTPQITTPPTEIGLTPKEAQEFSICRATMAYLNNDWRKAGFELEASKAVVERLGTRPGNGGFFVPLEVQRAFLPSGIQRAMSVGDAAAGGYLVADDHRADLFIDGLRANSIAFQAGVQIIAGLVGNVEIPREVSGTTFYWLAEGEPAGLTDPKFGLTTLTPKTLAGGVSMTRRLMMQSTPDVENYIRQKMILDAALKLDLSIFEGNGATQPRGILNHPDINEVTIATDDAPTYDEVVQFETAVDTANALAGSLRYVMTPALRGKLKTTKVDAGSGIFVMSPDGEVNGYPSFRSSQLTANTLMFGNFSDAIVGMWGVLEIKPDEAGLASSGGLILRLFQDADLVIRHGKSFAKGV